MKQKLQRIWNNDQKMDQIHWEQSEGVLFYFETFMAMKKGFT